MWKAITVFALIFHAACQDGTGTTDDWSPYPGVPVLERQVFDVTVAADLAQCYGFLPDPVPCPEVTFPDGRVERITEGIRGYTHEGQAARIRIEQVTLDASGPDFPTDVGSIVYRQVAP